MSDQWYYSHDRATRGPVSLDQLQQLAAAGEVSEDSLVWREGMTEWLPASALGIVVRRSAPPPPPPPPVAPPPVRSLEPPPVGTSVAMSATAKLPLGTVVAVARPHRARERTRRTSLLVFIGLIALVLAVTAGWVAHVLFQSLGGTTRGLSAAPVAQVNSDQDANERESVRPVQVASRATVAAPNSSSSAATDVVPPTAVPVVPPDSIPATAVSTPPPAPSTPVSSPNVASPSPVPPASGPATVPATTAASASGTPVATALKTLFQEIEIERKPRFSILGNEMSQDLHYKILSELHVEAPDNQGVRVVQQAVLDTRLIRADQLSQATFAGSLRELKGSRFRFKVNARGDVSELAANPKGGRQAVAVEQQGNKGFLMTSVMDPDGWKEVSEWTFFAPPAQNNGSLPWSRRITHDYGPLGSWYGETQFRRSSSQNTLLRIDFAHQLAYQPPAKDTGALPFAIKSASLRPEVAGGVIDFDARAGRIAAVQERFVLKGTINTELVGQEVAIEMEETQDIVVRLFESPPWK